jgi:D-aminopeptidase
MPRTGALQPGAGDRITDVGGVAVGHCTLADGACQTGVTVVVPHPGDLFLAKAPAAVTVLNGFGKRAGLVQVQELGVLETPSP